jgi:hypothetical protein
MASQLRFVGAKGSLLLPLKIGPLVIRQRVVFF